MLFVQSLWHGAKELRSRRVRRTVYYSYSPYHFANWHGLTYSEELKARVEGRRNELLSGPFIGSRLPHVDTRNVPRFAEFPEFPELPESERGPRAIEFDATREESRFGRVFAAAAHAFDPGRPEFAGRDGRCQLNVRGAGTWCCEFNGGVLHVARAPEASVPEADAVLETSAEELVRVLGGHAAVAEVFHGGRVTVRGDMSLVMRLASVLMTVGALS